MHWNIIEKRKENKVYKNDLKKKLIESQKQSIDKFVTNNKKLTVWIYFHN